MQALPRSNNTDTIDFNQYNLGSSQDLRSPPASEVERENDQADRLETIHARALTLPADALSTRSEHIKGLKLKDLARERATRIRSRHQGSGLDDAIVVEKPSLIAEEQITPLATHAFKFPIAPTRPLENPHEPQTGGSRPASRQESLSRRPSYNSRRSSSNRTSQRGLRVVMNPSQIMVLAETNPDTQMFRASTPTGSIRRNDSKKADSVILAKERRVRRRKSKSSIRSQAYTSVTASAIPVIKPNGQHTPPLSDPSTHSSEDDHMECMRRSKSRRSVNHIAALVKEDSDIESAPSKRAFAALARREEKKYFKDQLLLKKLKRESSELKLAVRLLSRGLEKLTIFVEADEELVEERGHGLIEAERSARTHRPKGDREAFERISTPHRAHDDDHAAGKSVRNEGDAAFRRKRSDRAVDERPISLVSRYSSVKDIVGESVGTGPPVQDEVIWDQVEIVNRMAIHYGGGQGR